MTDTTVPAPELTLAAPARHSRAALTLSCEPNGHGTAFHGACGGFIFPHLSGWTRPCECPCHDIVTTPEGPTP
jgi:hypothetical protein